MDRRDLQEMLSSDDEMDASELRGRLQKLTARAAGIESPEFTSPIGSPPGDDSALRAKGRFMEMKRMMQEDKKARRSKRKQKIRDPEVEGFEQIEDPDDDWEQEGSISPASYHDDVDELLESFRSERAGERDLSIVAHRVEHHPKMMEVCQQLRERDQNILSLESKVMELDRQVIDLQDTLSEKDKLLNSKNDAVNCMVAQYQQSIVDRDEELSKTQETLFELEKKFGAAQNTWKTEKDRLNAEIKQQNQRLKDLEDTNKLLSSARVEQTSRDIELEEKLSVLKQDRDRLTRDNVSIQSLLDTITQEKGALEVTLSEKTDQFTSQIETCVNQTKLEYEAKLTKMKKQFALKLKQVKESSVDIAETATVQDLQKQLVELQEKLYTKIEETESLLTEKSALQTTLDSLKSELLESEVTSNNSVQLLAQISSLNNNIIEIEAAKQKSISTLQDELSQLRSEKSAAEKDFNERLSQYEQNFEKTILDYESRLENQEQDLQKEKEELSTALEKSKEQLNKMKKQFQTKLKAAREGQQQGASSESSDGHNAELLQLQTKYTALEQRNIELEEEKGNNLFLQEELAQLKQDKESLSNELSSHQHQLITLQTCLDKAAEQINQFETKMKPQGSPTVNFFTTESSSAGDAGSGWESDQTDLITSLEHKVATLEEEKGSTFLLQEDVGQLRAELETDFQEKSAAYEKTISLLEEQLAKSTEQLTKMKRQFQLKLKSLRDENKAVKESTSSTSSSPCPEVDTNLLLEKITQLENKVAELEEEKGNLLLQMVDFDEQQAQLRSTVTLESTPPTAEDTIRLEISLSEREEELRQAHHQLDILTSALSQKNVEVEQLMKTCSDMESSLQQNIEELSTSISTKDDEINVQISAMEAQLSVSSAIVEEKEGAIRTLEEKLRDMEARFTEMQSLLGEYQGMVDTARTSDAEELSSLKEELDSIRAKAGAAEQSFSAMKATYISESEQLSSTIAHLQDQLSSLQISFNVQSESYSSLKSSKEKSDSDFTSQIETLSSALATSHLELETLRTSASSTMQTVDLQTTEIEEREATWKHLEQQLLDDISAKNDQIQGLSWSLENSKLDADSALAPLRAEISTLQQQLTEYAAYSESLKNELDSFRNHYTTLESKYSRLHSEFTQKSDSFEQSSILIASLQGQTTLLEGEKASLLLQIDTLTSESDSLRNKLTGLTTEFIQLRESFETKDSETRLLRQDADTLQSDYSHSNNELKLKISSLMDQLNETEAEISVVTTRLQESDDSCTEIRTQLDAALSNLKEKSSLLEEKSKAFDSLEKEVFEKNEENLRLEEKLREIGEKHRLEVEANFVKYSDDLDVTYDQLALTASENLSLHEKLRKMEEQIGAMGREAVSKYDSEIASAREQISMLESQLTRGAQQFAELQTHTAQESAWVTELKRQIEEKEHKLEELELELEQFKKNKNTRVVTEEAQMTPETPPRTAQSLWGPVHQQDPVVAEDPFANITYEQSNLVFAATPALPPPLSASEPSASFIEKELLIESQLKELRIKDLETQVTELAAEVEELRSLHRASSEAPPQIESMWGPPPPYQQDPFASFTADPETVNASTTTTEMTTDHDNVNPSTIDLLGQKDARIYDLEVLLAEMQINIDDANIQLGEITELKTSYEVLSYQIKELEDINSKLRQELYQERNKPLPPPVIQQIFVPSTPSGPPTPVEEPLISPSTAYVTTQPEQQSATSTSEVENATKEIKELKVKNGKMLQRFKQLKTQYDTILQENEGFKTKQQFSLSSAFEDEFFSQVKVKDDLLLEKGKQVEDLLKENARLVEKVDLLEKGTALLTQMKEEQDTIMEGLGSSKRALETEVSALKWKMEELENISLARVHMDSGSHPVPDGSVAAPSEHGGYFDVIATNPDIQENSSLRSENAVLCLEIQHLREEIETKKKSLDDLFERNEQLEDELEKIQELQIDQRMRTPTPNSNLLPPSDDNTTVAVHPNNQLTSVDSNISSLQASLQIEQAEKVILERKIELLQTKISEIEISEIKCFEESLMLKGWTRQLELDNLKIQREMERIYGSIQDGDTSNIKAKVMQDEIIRLVDTLHDRDKRCEQLTVEITRLLEERDTLQLKLSNVLRHNVTLHEEANKGRDVSPPDDILPSYNKEGLQLKLAELEQMNYSMGIDLRREREARRLVQEQLFFSSSSRIYPGSGGNRAGSSPNRSRSPPASPLSFPSSIPPPPPPVQTPQQQQPLQSGGPPPPLSPVNPSQEQFLQQQQSPQPQFFQQDIAQPFPPPPPVIQPPQSQVQSGAAVAPPNPPQNEGQTFNVQPPPSSTQHQFNI